MTSSATVTLQPSYGDDGSAYRVPHIPRMVACTSIGARAGRATLSLALLCGQYLLWKCLVRPFGIKRVRCA